MKIPTLNMFKFVHAYKAIPSQDDKSGKKFSSCILENMATTNT
jgi:hypothetical protein